MSTDSTNTTPLKSANFTMKTTAAVLVETKRPLELAELSIPRLAAGQVLVEVSFSGVCQTQVLESRGYRGHDPYLPHCLGHEGSGVVLETGPGVVKCQPGQRVILSWLKGSGANVAATVYQWNGRAVNAGSVTTFARHTVVSENRVTVVPELRQVAGAVGETTDDLLMERYEISDREAALLGCAVATGFGAVLNTVAPTAGQSGVVFGVGGIGLCAVAAAVACGVSPLIAVDLDDTRLDAARQMGATQTINAAVTSPLEGIRQRFPAGVDFAIEASGRPEVMRWALAAVRGPGGTAVLIGNARHGERLELDPREFNLGKRLLGTWGGDTQPDWDFPRYCRMLAGGEVDLAPLLARTYPLSQINAALDDLEAHRVIRPLIDMSLS